jgi:hypothetical protein
MTEGGTLVAPGNNKNVGAFTWLLNFVGAEIMEIT